MESLIQQLMACLKDLDALGHDVAAAHVNAAIECLIPGQDSEANLSEMDVD